MRRKPYVFITRELPDSTIEPLLDLARVSMWEESDRPVTRRRLEVEAAEADALLTMVSDPVDRELLEGAPNLRVVSNMGVGYDNVDLEAANELGILVCNTPDILTETTADLTFALLLASARRITEASELVRSGSWQEWGPMLMAGRDVYGKTLGIVGMGRIGTAVAKRASGFNMNILYHNRTRKKETESVTGASWVELEELLQESDFVVCLAPLTEETKRMFSYEQFRRMKETAFFINASRGGLVYEKGLVKALEERQIAGAGLDVFEEEPIDPGHPLLSFPNVTVLPHIGSASVDTRKEMARMASRNIAHVLKGYRPKAIVNRVE
ncbi:2-hydroxyacid dehydrogenase [Alteribacter natronophilus]|uniref:2-hydroxyacid dehydrogenase n=1 Tax=Alteribacter natronophilus TaxID=2583810 RepID=UPI00110DB27B|nr:D-glycerate dehydrogenase [Alteribacter natronophilus]TMW72489.1 D-glycerate dehydrogenase [Alteribacter natronophilus]